VTNDKAGVKLALSFLRLENQSCTITQQR
jgi:hypothetical protein